MPAPVSASVPAPAPAAAPRGGGILESLLSMLPGIGVEIFQRAGYYRTNPMAAVQFLAPVLLSSLATGLAPKLGRPIAILLVLVCLGWLAWPLVAGWAGLQANPGASLRDHAGRGLAGMSMLYMIPRLWQAGSRR
jgi:hypothetical protein